MLRIGCVKYLNARPLIHGWSGAVDFDHPAALCRKPERGGLDVALVSSLEYLRRPIYRIVDRVSISAHGAVYSVIVAHRGDLARALEIKLDPASETSVALLRCLLSQRDLNPRLVSWRRPLAEEPAEDHRQDAGITARLLIGDHAIRFRAGLGQTFRPDRASSCSSREQRGFGDRLRALRVRFAFRRKHRALAVAHLSRFCGNLRG